MKTFKKYIDNLHENKHTLNDVREWLRKVDRDYINNSNDFYVMSNKDGTFRIDAGTVRISTFDTELPYDFYECDRFKINAPLLKTLKNFPSKSMQNIHVEFYFSSCVSLDFANTEYTLPMCEITLDNMPNIHLEDFKKLSLNSNIKSISFDRCLNPKLHDVSTYNTHILCMDMSITSKLKNVTSVLTNNNCKLQHLRFINDVEMQHFNSYELSIIIAKYLGKHNKNDYVMDMTLEMIDAGFEDEV